MSITQSIAANSSSHLNSSSQSNQFYIYINHEVIPWNIYEESPGNCGFVAYFSGVLKEIDRTLPNEGLTFYVTMTEMEDLPTYGENVIVFILGDEFYRIPNYIHKVGSVFKCYGTRQVRQQFAIYGPALEVSYFKLLLLGQFGRNLVYRLPAKIRYRWQKLKRSLFGKGKVTAIHDIPPGYYNSENLDILPIAERPFDVYFDGSVVQKQYPVWSLRYWTKTPKTFCREQMVKNLQHFAEKFPQFNIKLATLFEFGLWGDRNAKASSYSQNMMNTKICLVPRGTTLETYRFFEAMRYGCVIIAETLPPHWYYQGAPVIQIGSWNKLEPVLKKLLENPALLEELHQRTLRWWETKCSEQAVGQFASAQISTQLLSRSFQDAAISSDLTIDPCFP